MSPQLRDKITTPCRGEGPCILAQSTAALTSRYSNRGRRTKHAKQECSKNGANGPCDIIGTELLTRTIQYGKLWQNKWPVSKSMLHYTLGSTDGIETLLSDLIQVRFSEGSLIALLILFQWLIDAK